MKRRSQDDLRSLTEAQLEMEKIRRECMRLEQQINLEARPWWRKPGTWATILPIALSVATFGAQVYKSYYQNIYDNIVSVAEKTEQTENRTENLNIAIEKKTKHNKKEQDDLRKQKLILDKKTRDLEKVKEDFQSAKNELTKRERHLLRDMNEFDSIKIKLEDERLEIAAQLDATRRKLLLAPTEVRIGDLSRIDEGELWPLHDTLMLLVTDIKAMSPDQVENAEEKILEKRDNKLLYANLLYALYAGTNNAKGLDKLLALASSATSEDPDAFWLVYGCEFAYPDDQLKVWETVIPLIKSLDLSDAALSNFLLSFQYLPEHLPPLSMVLSESDYHDLVKLAKNLAEGKSTPPIRMRGVSALVGLDPDKAVDVIGHLLVHTELPPFLKVEIESLIDEAASDIYSDINIGEFDQPTGEFGDYAVTGPFGRALKKVDFPYDDISNAPNWLQQRRAGRP